MKLRLLGSLILLASLCRTAAADPLFITETVSRVEAGTMGVEVRPNYRSDKFKIKTTNTIAYTATLVRTEVRARWAPAQRCEAYVEAPLVKTDITANTVGAPGTVDGTKVFDTSDGALSPFAFVATTTHV